MSEHETEQESFWAGEFGDEYTNRNAGDQWVASNLSFFSRIFAGTENIRSVLELGANLGLNLLAIRKLVPRADIAAVEINSTAVGELNKLEDVEVHHASILDFHPPRQFDFVFTKGVLIHINPGKLHEVYDIMYASSSRYLCVAEYYNPSPQEISYRGHEGRLFKRDFAGDLLRYHDDLRLLDYGFAYHADTNFPQDDITWFLLEKPAQPSTQG